MWIRDTSGNVVNLDLAASIEYVEAVSPKGDRVVFNVVVSSPFDDRRQWELGRQLSRDQAAGLMDKLAEQLDAVRFTRTTNTRRPEEERP